MNVKVGDCCISIFVSSFDLFIQKEMLKGAASRMYAYFFLGLVLCHQEAGLRSQQ